MVDMKLMHGSHRRHSLRLIVYDASTRTSSSYNYSHYMAFSIHTHLVYLHANEYVNACRISHTRHPVW
uniref:Uncharacterized protein n=1 Tax=Pararge aegeria TaxID=116150 RepID=S4NVS3_9NEOP